MKVLGSTAVPDRVVTAICSWTGSWRGPPRPAPILDRVYVRDLKISGCLECGACEETGACVIPDQMEEMYPRLQEARVIFMAAPMFFYGVPAQLKALVDRSQALWSGRRLVKTPEQWKNYDRVGGILSPWGLPRARPCSTGRKGWPGIFTTPWTRAMKAGCSMPRSKKRAASGIIPRPCRKLLTWDGKPFRG